MSRSVDWVYFYYMLLVLFVLWPKYCTKHFGNNAFESYKVHLNTKLCVHQTDEKFLSIALGSTLLKRRWKNFDFNSKKLRNLAKGLAPAYLRIAGKDQDFLLFDPVKINRKTTPRRRGRFKNFTIAETDVNNIFTFAKDNGLSILFGLNVLLRDSNTDSWNYTNAEILMKYINDKGFSCGWELGNEPVELLAKINWAIAANELASDFKILRKLLNEHPEYGQMIVGPDVSSPWRKPIRNKYLEEFLTNIGGSIDAITYHQYYTNNQATVSKFYDPRLLDSLITEIQQVKSIMKESGATSISLWLGETSSAYGGGVPGVSDSYVAGFMWLDKLGVAARLKHDVVIRQAFYGGSYSLINLNTLDPFPDYWSAFLYKKLVGSRVLEVHGGISLGRPVRVYAHCTSERSRYDTGSIVLVALNTQHNQIQLVLANGLEKLLVHQYLLTPGESNELTSQTVRLNDEVLQMVDDTFLPNVKPKLIIPPDKIILPPVSYGFFVVPEAQIEACQTGNLKMEELVKFFM